MAELSTLRIVSTNAQADLDLCCLYIPDGTFSLGEDQLSLYMTFRYFTSFYIILYRIRRDFTFDDGVAKTFGCEVHSFDPK